MAIERKRRHKPPPPLPAPELGPACYYGTGANWHGRPMRPAPALAAAAEEDRPAQIYHGHYPHSYPSPYRHSPSGRSPIGQHIGFPQPPYDDHDPIPPAFPPRRTRKPQLPPPPPPRPSLSSSVPFTQQPDPRLPPRGMYPPDPIDFPSADLEFAAHRIQLLAPDAPALAALLARAREKRAASRDDDFPEELVARSLRSQALWHVSDGPRGGVWVVEGGREEVVVALVEEMEGLKEGRMRDKGALGREIGVRDVDAGSARWEVLGVGSGGSEGRVFLVHGCGVGPVVVGSEKKGGKGGVRGRAKVISESLRGIFG